MIQLNPKLLSPWPIEKLVQRLSESEILHTLTRAKETNEKRNIREAILERLAGAVMIETFGESSVMVRRPIADTLGLSNRSFPGRSLPDIAILHEGRFHICELKSNRTDYSRFDCVLIVSRSKNIYKPVARADNPPGKSSRI